MPNRIKELRKARGWTQAQLADAVGNTTGEQMRKLESGERRLNLDWLQRLAHALDVTPNDLVESASGFAEDEASFIAEDQTEEVELRLGRLLYPGGLASTMVVRGRSLELDGYRPGDHILVDLNRKPQAGEPVVAQIYDDDLGSAETVLRILRPPMLVPRSTQPRYEPVMLDAASVRILGVIVGRYSSEIFAAAAVG